MTSFYVQVQNALEHLSKYVESGFSRTLTVRLKADTTYIRKKR